MQDRRYLILLYLVPILALAVCGLSLFWGIDDSEMRSAVLMGGPTDSDGGFRGRLRAVKDRSGVIVPLAGERVRVIAQQGSHRAERRLTTGPDGWTEFEVSRQVDAPLQLTLLDSRGSQLVAGSPQLRTERWRASAQVRGGELRVHREGGLEGQLIVPDGLLVVPFESEVVLEVRADGEPAMGAQVQVEGTGAELLSSASCEAGEEGRCRFRLRPFHHVASLIAHVEFEGKKLSLDQVLPLVPGSLGMKRRDDGGIDIFSPVPREDAWFTFVTQNERLPGGRVEFTPQADGGGRATIDSDQVPSGDGRYLVLAGSADGRSTSTVGFPLDAQGESFDVVDAYLLDGAPQVRALRHRRARKVTWALGGYIALSGLITLFLFVTRVRRADASLKMNLERVGAARGTQSESPLPLVIAALTLFFAFSATVLWIVAR